jgi:hypothetical protein
MLASNPRRFLRYRWLLGLAASGANSRRTDADHHARLAELCDHLVDTRHGHELDFAASPQRHWRLDQLAQRLDQPRHRPGRNADEILPTIQTLI